MNESSSLTITMTANSGDGSPTLTGQLRPVINPLFAFLVILGIVVDPTTEGVGDSTRAMSYVRPATSKVEQALHPPALPFG